MTGFPDIPLITWEDEVVGQAQLSVVRKLGLPARAARVFLVNDNEVLLQKRGAGVDHDGVEDCSAEGWVDIEDTSDSGEPGDYSAAGARESGEELGLTIVKHDLVEVAHYLFHTANTNPPEWTKLFVVEYLPDRHGDVRHNDEVAGTQWIGIGDAHQWARSAPQDFEPGAPLALDYLAKSM